MEMPVSYFIVLMVSVKMLSDCAFAAELLRKPQHVPTTTCGGEFTDEITSLGWTEGLFGGRAGKIGITGHFQESRSCTGSQLY